MNNFSISTDQLAQGLQNTAAVLKTQGNDIDEALALLTAGNAVTQDISKASMGEMYAQTYSDVWVFYILISSYIGQRPEMVKTEQRH